VRLRLQRIPEKDQKVDLPFGDLRADLQVAAERAALHPVNGNAQLALQQPARCACGINLVLDQRCAVEAHPLHQIVLAAVVRHQGDMFLAAHGQCC